ncbi:MAG: shikimate kinase [Bryobacter sp.]|nr:shikimate kinase [Bryobacter sp.]
MNLKLKRTPGLWLVGFMGSGKSTVGQQLANALGWLFVDLDTEIEREQGRTISAIFEAEGEREFREIEHKALRRLLSRVEAGRPHVVALGGGAFAEAENYDLLEHHGVTIFLDCSLERIRARIEGHEHRPLARDPERFEALYRARRMAYARADFRIPIETDEATDAVRAILALPLF